MAKIIKARRSPVIDGDFVVFIIGMRVNKPWKVWKWLPVFLAMPKMLRELESAPELDLLGYHAHAGNPFAPVVVQYWRSFEHLERFARAKDHTHFPAWTRFNRAIGSNGDVGIWHETFCVAAGEYEAVYNNMPAYGLGTVGTLIPASGRHQSAAGRIGLARTANGAHGSSEDEPERELTAP